MDHEKSRYRRSFVLIVFIATVFTFVYTISMTNVSKGGLISTNSEIKSSNFTAIVSETIRNKINSFPSYVPSRSFEIKPKSFSEEAIFEVKLGTVSNNTNIVQVTSSTEEALDTLFDTSAAKPMSKKYYKDLKCPRENPVPGKNLPKIALASFPRSGNGWTRRLIQYATGLYVGSAGWTNQQTHRNTDIFPATGKDVMSGRVVIIKTHGGPTAELDKEAVLLIRNPYRSIVSDVYRRVFERNDYSRQQMLNYFKTEKWREEARRLVTIWKGFAIKWVKQSKRLLVVANERLFNNTESELSRILDFIHQPLNIKMIKCGVKAYYPTASANRFSLDPYTEDMREVIDSSIEEVNRTLAEYGQPTLPKYEKILLY